MRNLRGRLAISRDEAGIVTIARCAPSGAILKSTRQLRADYKSEPDWSDPVAIALERDLYTSSCEIDALGRTTAVTQPDGTTQELSYLRGGELARLTISSSDGKVQDLTVVADCAYDTYGRRTAMSLGNGIDVRRDYDEQTRRVARISAARGALGLLQDIQYTYDPVGNVVVTNDLAQAPAVLGPFLRGLHVSPECDYTYDARYQLTAATGRTHPALSEGDYRPGAAGTVNGTRQLSLNDGSLIERYRRTFSYDDAGNITGINHRAATNNWTTQTWISPVSNRSLPAFDLSGAPIADLQTRFDDAGNITYLPHLEGLSWSYRSGLERAVVIDRSARALPDDAEYYQYDANGERCRKVFERLVHGDQLEITDTIYLDGCEIKRMRADDAPFLERLTTHVSDGGRRTNRADPPLATRSSPPRDRRHKPTSQSATNSPTGSDPDPRAR